MLVERGGEADDLTDADLRRLVCEALDKIQAQKKRSRVWILNVVCAWCSALQLFTRRRTPA